MTKRAGLCDCFGHVTVVVALLVIVSMGAPAEEYETLEGGWRQRAQDLEGLKGKWYAAVGHPAKSVAPLTYGGEKRLAPGLYRLRLTVRPSHVCDQIAWNGRLRLELSEGIEALSPTAWAGIYFARVNKPETREVDLVVKEPQALAFLVRAEVDHGLFEQAMIVKNQRSGKGEVPSISLRPGGEEEKELQQLSMALELDPKTHFYYLVEKAELARLSGSAYVRRVFCNKILYEPGETMQGHAVVRAFEPDAKGVLGLYLEHDVKTRELIRELPLTLKQPSTTVPFEVDLPEQELGYAIVARWRSEDGGDVAEAAEYFNIAKNFYRVAIHGFFGGHGYSHMSEEASRRAMLEVRKNYWNCKEVFAWAEEDMVEMSPEGDYWFSGQTCYHTAKEGLQKFIAAAHEHGIAMVTYGKFVMSGYLGWKTAYDYPWDHKKQYFFPCGMWEGVEVDMLDKFKHKEFVSHLRRPHLPDALMRLGRAEFMPINPDPTPRMARVAAEEVVRSIEMFGWDGVRWDGHPRGGGQCGGARTERYDWWAQKKTALLVRYFKDIVSSKYPKFQHGYNYMSVQHPPDHGWAKEDWELNELCRGGGLLMNETIRKQYKQTYQYIAENVQVEGDLTRERGGFLLGISTDNASPRDALAETVIYFAGGCRGMGGVVWGNEWNAAVNRYGTRYSKYTFDETMRRITKPEALLKPQAETHLWWDPFVYETQPKDGRSQLVVNLINIPRKARLKASEGARNEDLTMLPGTDPVRFELTLPESHQVTGAHLIDPWTLKVETLPIEGGRVQVPPVAVWRVMILDLKMKDGAAPLAAELGPPKTLGVKREDVKVERKEIKPLDIDKDVVEVNKRISDLLPGSRRRWWEERPALAEIDWEERSRTLLQNRQPMKQLTGKTWYRRYLPDDLKLKDEPPEFGDLTPRRDGVMDIFYARGAMDYRLRFYETVAALPRLRVQEATLFGHLKHGGYHLRNNVAPAGMPEFDVMVYVDVPHPAIGVRHSYALADYVKAGGGLLVTGGEYAFGKGKYPYTVLDRELLPVISIETVDGRYVQEPLHFEAGKDLGELGVELDLSARPAFWCWNEVAVRPGADVKVFLKSGNRPVLVGWEFGKGRVVCFLPMHRGKSERDVTAFFDWEDWPRLTGAVLNWLAPRAYQTDATARTALSEEELAELRKQFEGRAMEDMVRAMEPADTDPLSALAPGGTGGPAPRLQKSQALDPKTLRERIITIRRLLNARGREISELMAQQMTTVSNLPVLLKADMAHFVRTYQPAELAKTAQAALQDRDPDVRGCGYMLLAIAGDAAFGKLVRSGPSALETDTRLRERYLAMAMALYSGDDLEAVARKRIADWNAQEERVKTAYTRGEGFSMANPWHPCLSEEKLLARIGWLAYMTRLAPEEYGAQFAHEWTMVAQYRTFLDETIHGMFKSLRRQPQRRDQVIKLAKQLRLLQGHYAMVGRVAEPQMLALFDSHPKVVSQGFARAHYLSQAKTCMALLGPRTVEQTRTQLEALTGADQVVLARWVRQRLAAHKNKK